MTKFHRDAPEMPVELAAIKEEIYWIEEHPLWHYPIEFADGKIERLGGGFQRCVHFDFVYVNPETECIEDDKELNTAFRIWVEAGGWFDLSKEDPDYHPAPDEGWNQHNKWSSSHDLRLDFGAPTMEQLLLELAQLVRFFYNEDGSPREAAPEACDGHFVDEDEDEYVSDCEDAGDGYCKVCGFAMGED